MRRNGVEPALLAMATRVDSWGCNFVLMCLVEVAKGTSANKMIKCHVA